MRLQDFSKYWNPDTWFGATKPKPVSKGKAGAGPGAGPSVALPQDLLANGSAGWEPVAADEGSHQPRCDVS